MEGFSPAARSAGSSTARLSGGAGEDLQHCQNAPLVGAVGVGNARRGRHGNSVRAARTRARCRMLGSRLSRRIIRERGRRAAGNERVELVEVEDPLGMRGDEMAATGPGGASHTEAVDQEQHQRPVAHRVSRLKRLDLIIASRSSERCPARGNPILSLVY